MSSNQRESEKISCRGKKWFLEKGVCVDDSVASG